MRWRLHFFSAKAAPPARPKYTMTRRRAEAIEFVADLLDEVGAEELEEALLFLVRRKPPLGQADLEESEALDEVPEQPIHTPIAEEAPLASEPPVRTPPVPAAPAESGPKPSAISGETTAEMLAKREEMARKRAARVAGESTPAEVVPSAAPRQVGPQSPFGRPREVSLSEIDSER